MKAARTATALGNAKPSDIVFHAVFPKPGLYKGFAQFKHNGKILTYPFVIDAQPGDGAAEHDHDHAEPAGHDHDHGHGSHGGSK